MRVLINYRPIVFFIFILLIGTCFAPLTMPQNVNQKYEQRSCINEGGILFAPMQSKKTYLIDSNKVVTHTWSSDYTPGESVYMLKDGTILRTIKLSLSGGGAGGGVQKITWDDSLIWDFRYYTDDYLSHHDIEPLPNGNILMIAWEYKTRNEAIAAGRDPNRISGNTVNPDHVIEVKPTGPKSGEIVWEWHVWDHLIQDFDPLKDNYGVVEDHPELIDINLGSIRSDWLHTNSIDYNEELDQILLSVPYFHEIWVIDHSTTTEEAAGHTGGNSSMGGDILYRWGNPRAYRAGTYDDQIFQSQHDARWIESGCPGEGNILVFNNVGGLPEGFYSTVDEIEPPIDENGKYILIPGEAYGPEEQTWIYEADFYTYYLGSTQRLPNGNTLVCDGPSGKFIEIDVDGTIIWDYNNIFPNPLQNNVFKIIYYPPGDPQHTSDLDCIGNLNWINVGVGEILNGEFQVKNVGCSMSLLNWTITSFPSWGNWSFTPKSGQNLTPEMSPLTVQVIVVAPYEGNKAFDGYVRIENKDDPDDYDVIPVYLKTERKRSITTPFLEFLKNHPNLFPILQLLIRKFVL